MPSSPAARFRQCDTDPKRSKHARGTQYTPRFGYTVSLEWERDSGETHIVVTDCGSSCVLIFPVLGENAGEAFRHPFRYAP
jgi:hypothetical protein